MTNRIWINSLKVIAGLILILTNYCHDPDDNGGRGTSCITLISPQNQAVLDNGCYPVMNTISWFFKWKSCSGTTSYRLYVKRAATTMPLIDIITNDTVYRYTSDGAISNNDILGWKWKVYVSTDRGTGEWSEERTFDVEQLNTDCIGITITPAMARDSLYYIMKDWYYWYNMPEIVSITVSNKGNYEDPYKLLEAMRYQVLDRWSFVADYDKFLADMQGTFVGHGFSLGIDGSGNARIALIYDKSPLYLSGVRRGWIVKKINDTEVAPILIRGDAAAYSSLIGPNQAGITNVFLFQRPDGTEVTISSTKSAFTVNTILKCDTLHLLNGITGHLVTESFIVPTAQELEAAFAFFKANDVKDLILDLRYNGGGYINIAQILASYIAGDARQGNVFVKLQYNDKRQEANLTYNFLAVNNSIALPRLVVITKRSTASASEAVINGLRPYVYVVTIGDTTYGKPVGMTGWAISQKYYMWPVTFKIVNVQDQGDYYDGLLPNKFVTDDITHDFSDKEELCLKEAIHYLETGSFTTKRELEFKRNPVYSEKPDWMNNSFVNIK
jgi:carboxyl-terminal processing protease